MIVCCPRPKTGRKERAPPREPNRRPSGRLDDHFRHVYLPDAAEREQRMQLDHVRRYAGLMVQEVLEEHAAGRS
jgi:hypothetical protein